MTLKQISITVFLALSLLAHKTYAHKAFIENIGQVNDQYQNPRADIIAKHSAGAGFTIFLSQAGIHYQWAKDTELYRMDVKLIGANPHPRISKEGATRFREQYQLPGVKGTAYSYGRITYHEIYPGIDWTFYFNADGMLEHDFIVKAGGNVADIKLQYAGADQIKIDRTGNLVATTKYGSISEPAPYSYELATNKKISSSYQLKDDILTFKTGTFNGSLVIDPVIDWSTYFGGSEYDEIRDVKIGKDSFVYVVGSTNSGSNIATVGAHLSTFQGGTGSQGSDAFISKFSVDGTCMWSTYYGGSNVDMGLSLAMDTAGHLYMAGRTNSQSGIATPGSYQQVKAGTSSGYDAFVTKFDTSGTPVWGTYYGGTGAEGQQAVVITTDKYDNIYLAGNTQSANSIATTGTFQPTRPGGEDGFIAKFTTSGSLVWGTYLGTASSDWINGIATDTSGHIVVVGQTTSTTGLATPTAYLSTGNGNTDGFVAQFDSAGQRLWSTYYGGDNNDRLFSVTTDSANAIYFSGVTYSATGIATSSAHQSVLAGNGDACIGKLNMAGNMEWSTYYGGSDNDIINAVRFAHGKLFATGWTISSNNIATTDAIVPVFNNSGSEGMLITLSPAGVRLYGSYFGGDMTEDPKSIAINDNEQVFIAGKTASVTGISTPGAHQSLFAGNQDGILFKINMCNVPETPLSILGNIIVCENSEQQYTIPTVNGADSYVWVVPNGWAGTSTTDTLNIIAATDGGSIKVAAVNTCGASDTISLVVTVNPAPVPVISRSGNILSVSQSFSSYQWLLNGNTIAGATAPTYAISGNGDYSLEVSGSNGCTGVSNEIIVSNHTTINELDKLAVKVFPNPFGERFTLAAPFDLTLAVTDLSGRVVKRLEIPAGSNEIDLSRLGSGNYLLQVYLAKNSKSLGAMTLVKLSK